MAEQELDKNIDYWFPFIVGMSTISSKEIEFMTGAQRSILNAAALRRVKILGRGVPNG